MKYIVIYTLLLTQYALQAQIELPPHMEKDLLHTPFHFGVASGDPGADGFVIWTCVDTTLQEAVTLNWQVSLQSDFATLEASGTVNTSPESKHTAKVRIAGLTQNERYYYRFSLNDQFSATGRGRKLPDVTDSLTFAVASCSSVYSGYFNAYGRIAEREELHFVLHLGDYIYDFVDEDEQVLLPEPYPEVPVTEDEWRERHRYYLMDPELRAMRQQHTMIFMWDNHDLDPDFPGAGATAFFDYVPVEPDQDDTLKLYRVYAFGELATLITADITLHRDDDLIGGAPSLLGTVQRQWLQQAYDESEATWRIIGNQKMMGGWYTTGIDPALLSLVPNDGEVFDSNSWDGYTVSRDSLLHFFRQQQVVNNVVLSGDAHITMAIDLIEDPYDNLSYDNESGEGAVGVEFLPASISRGNLNEQEPLTEALHDTLVSISYEANPHHLFSDFIGHGYGLLQVYPDSIVAEAWHSPILEQTNEELRVVRLKCLSGSGHWSRDITTTIRETPPETMQLYPNPAVNEVVIELNEPLESLTLIDNGGKQIQAVTEQLDMQQQMRYRVDLAGYTPGAYVVIAALLNGQMIAKRLLLR